MTKDEAEKKLEQYENKPLGFCPILKTNCRMDCVCYEKAMIHKGYYSYDKYSFKISHCTSPIISGFIQSENV